MTRLRDFIALGLRSILAHRLRSGLTALGIVFGVASVVAMLSVAAGARRAALEQIRLLGTDTVRVRHVELTGEARERAKQVGSNGLVRGDAAIVAAALPGAEAIAPARFAETAVAAGGRESAARVVATSPDWARLSDLRAAEGRFLSDLDLRDAKRVAVLGHDVRSELFGPQNPIGHRVRIGESRFAVVGVMEARALQRGGSIAVSDPNRDVYVPLGAAAGLPSGGDAIDRIHELAIRVGSADLVQSAAEIARRALGLAHGVDDDLEVVVPAELLASARRTQRIFDLVMGSIAAISLLVGGIGIMNVMLTSVTERTREIGVRRAVGATQRAILWHFLLEAVLVSVGGGAAGIAVGFALGEAFHLFAGFETAISAWSVVVAFGVSAAVGVAFGVHPALRAARMDPILALRFE
jgi:putative ABC transport system permease protein